MGRQACIKPGHTPRPDGRCIQCIKASQARHYRANSAMYKARAAEWAKQNPEVRAAIARRKKYGFDPPRPCPDLCELCRRRKAVCLDHDHVTGLFRGWLCRSCNTALGALGDTIDGLYTAIAYLLS